MVTPNHSVKKCGVPEALTSAVIFKKCGVKSSLNGRNATPLEPIS